MSWSQFLLRESRVLATMLIVGVAGVYLYQQRPNAPHHRVEKLVDAARKSANEGEPGKALDHTLQALEIIKETNPQDHHLFSFAFAIAAQYSEIGELDRAIEYYKQAQTYLPFVEDTIERDVGTVVALDRIAQCFQDKGEVQAANRLYRQAIVWYDDHCGQNKISKTHQQLAQEITGVLHNYAHFLLEMHRDDEALVVVKRAISVAAKAKLPQDDRSRLRELKQTILTGISNEQNDEKRR